MSLLDLFGKDANFFTGQTPEQRARGAGQIAYESIPGVSEAVTYRDIKAELGKENPNWWTIGLLGGAGILGLIPLVGDAAGSAIRQGVRARNAVKLNPAQQQSQEVIDLLKSGKSNQVTDQMLDHILYQHQIQLLVQLHIHLSFSKNRSYKANLLLSVPSIALTSYS